MDGGKGRACRGASRGDNQAMISRGGSFFLGRQRGDFELLRRYFLLESLGKCLERVAFWIVLLFFCVVDVLQELYIYIDTFNSFQIMNIQFEFGVI